MRATCQDHQPHPARSADTVAHWRMDETLAAADIASTGPSRTLTVTASPTVQPSLFNSNAVSGARGFNGTTQYASRAAADGDEASFQWAWGAAGGITFESWIYIDSAGAGTNRCIVSLGEYASPETAAENIQFDLRITTTNVLRVRWEHSTGTNVDSTTASTIATDVAVHLGVIIDDDPDTFDTRRVRVYINGTLLETFAGKTPPTGGSTARWFVAAEIADTALLGAVGNFFRGKLDDMRISKFAASDETILYDYARGVRDFDELYFPGDCAFREVHWRVLIYDQFGALLESYTNKWVDLTDLYGWNFLKKVSIKEASDQQVATARVALYSRVGELSVSPFITPYGTYNNNPINGNAGDLSDDEGLIGAMRRVKVLCAVVPWGTGREGAAPYYRVRFDGHIKNISLAADGDETILDLLDRGCIYQDVQVEPQKDGTDRAYGDAAGTSVQAELQSIITDNDPAKFEIVSIDDDGGSNRVKIVFFSASTASWQGRPSLLAVGDYVKVTGTTNYNAIYTVLSVGADGTTATMNETTGGGIATETSGTATLLPSMSYIGLGDYKERLEIWTETSPSWNVYEWTPPATQSVFQAVDDVMKQLGWRFGMRFDDHRQMYRPSIFYGGNIGANEEAFLASSVLDASGFTLDALYPRNAVITEYEQRVDEASAVTGTLDERVRRRAAAVSTGLAKHIGRRVATIAVGAASNINSSSEAGELADNVLDDIRGVVADGPITTTLSVWTELYDSVDVACDIYLDISDLVTLTPIMETMFRDFTEFHPYVLGVSLDSAAASMTMTCREQTGSAINSRKSHHDSIQQNGIVEGLGLRAPVTPSAPGCTILSLGGTVRGVWVTTPFPVNDLNRQFDLIEIHISTSTGFTPVNTTLMYAGRAENAMVGGLAAATTYYCKIIRRDRMGNVSTASAQTSFTTAA